MNSVDSGVLPDLTGATWIVEEQEWPEDIIVVFLTLFVLNTECPHYLFQHEILGKPTILLERGTAWGLSESDGISISSYYQQM